MSTYPKSPFHFSIGWTPRQREVAMLPQYTDNSILKAVVLFQKYFGSLESSHENENSLKFPAQKEDWIFFPHYSTWFVKVGGFVATSCFHVFVCSSYWPRRLPQIGG